ncbi:SigE family RNA polymerase sigma factor [Myceligenerans indicum]|uniref:SigE family RNA polymerase sigma factor n=1 Tax=Myceligenerans indicum TaxID=2593663 RepID=A0ABS1LF75_9MICO|nr:SigE family RNA polymerase sigma factor [Myceligenerans indicum]MBL0884724.1 SigE family RNA polymerase sigma factor [Myceligenerans indicum]
MSEAATSPETRELAHDVEVVRAHSDPVAAFTAFAQESTPALYRIAYLLCGDEHRAHDLVQLALERTYAAWRRVGDGNPFAYARRVIVTARIDGWRRTRREVLSDDPAGGGGPTTPSSDLEIAERDRLVRALLALPLKQRRVVVLRYLLDRSEKETAAELGVSTGTVKSTASRALARLRTLVAPERGREARS